MRIVINFKDALLSFCEALSQDPYDNDVFWYVADIFEQLVRCCIDSNKVYTDTYQNTVTKIANEIGEGRPMAQSACDLAITQILDTLQEIFVSTPHKEMFKAKKDITRFGLSNYVIELTDAN